MSDHLPMHTEDDVVLFEAAGERLALPAAQVMEIVRPPTITRVPHSPPNLLGVANLRGRVLPVVSLFAVKPDWLEFIKGFLVPQPLAYPDWALSQAELANRPVWVETITYVGVSVTLVLIGVAATAIPALRASRIDPAVSLRNE